MCQCLVLFYSSVVMRSIFRMAGKILSSNCLSYSLSVLVLSGVWDGTAAGRRVRRLRRACAGGSGQRPSSPRAVACEGGPNGRG